MALWVWLGAIVGGILGAMGGGIVSALVVGTLGAGLGYLIGRVTTRTQAAEPPPPAVDYGARDDRDERSPGALHATLPSPGTSSAERLSMRTDATSLALEVLRRFDALEPRLTRIEVKLGIATEPGVASPLPGLERELPELELPKLEPARLPLDAPRSGRPIEVAGAPEALPSVAPSAPELVRAPDGTLSMPPREASAAADASAATIKAESPSASDRPPPPPRYGVSEGPAAPSTQGRLWGWLTGGNALTRIGIVILFFGVAFLLRYFGEIVNVPIELKLAAAGAGGLALAGIGVFLARRRPAYGLSLQGAGMGIVYLTVFAAFRLYEVLAPLPAIALLVLVAGATIVLALRHDSQPLAALALAGGFLAPILIRTGATSPAPLFGYFAILNAVVLALAWKRAWRPLNVLGFVFTFVLGALWGWRFYTPAHYATVQPFLGLFFLFYVGIAILYARRDTLHAKAPVDGILVFGVPIVGFALQMAIAKGHRYGVAWSAGVLAAFYAVLWLLLRHRAEAGLALLAKAFAALAVIFATLAIPFAADPRSTSAWWALEAAAVYWLGVVQRQRLARWFALLLQLAAAAMFAIELSPGEGALLLNANFLGMALIGLAAFATVWAGDRHPDALGPRERALVPVLFCWGLAWWTLGGVDEMRRQIAHPARVDAALAWVVGTSALALALRRWLAWPRIGWAAALLLPAMALAALEEFRAERTTLTHYGWVVWPLAWLVQWATLRAAEALRASALVDGRERSTVADFVRLAHAVSAIALVAWASWEASEWMRRTTSEGTVWIACAAALPAIVYLILVAHQRDSARWPFNVHANAYGASAGTSVAALLAVWFAFVNVVSPGDPAPLPFAPLANPLDLTLIAALVALWRWADVWGRMDDRTRFGWLGAAAFLALNGAVVRTAHHWGDVPWRLSALMASKPLHAALTLTWTATALALMLWATRRAVRPAWMVGAVLLAFAVVKLFAIDLAALSGLTRVVAFMGVGALLLVIGYVAPLPPSDPARADRDSR